MGNLVLWYLGIGVALLDIWLISCFVCCITIEGYSEELGELMHGKYLKSSLKVVARLVLLWPVVLARVYRKRKATFSSKK